MLDEVRKPLSKNKNMRRIQIFKLKKKLYKNSSKHNHFYPNKFIINFNNVCEDELSYVKNILLKQFKNLTHYYWPVLVCIHHCPENNTIEIWSYSNKLASYISNLLLVNYYNYYFMTIYTCFTYYDIIYKLLPIKNYPNNYLPIYQRVNIINS